MASPTSPLRATSCNGFTLIELLLVVAIIGVMSALILSAVTNATQDSRAAVSRQQQVVLQEALNSWISWNSSTGTNSLETTRAAYGAASTSLAKLNLVKDYLHTETYQHFTNYSSASEIKTEAMAKAGIYVRFSSWSSSNYPTVEMVQ